MDQQPLVLVPEGRSEPTVHDSADFRVEPLRLGAPPPTPDLPVAGLPSFPGEVRAVYRAKRRPAIILGLGGDEVPAALKTGAARYQTQRTMLVAPYYGVDRDGRRGGWRPEFVSRIQRCEYPQYVWDSLPIGGVRESVLRLDHLQPLSGHGQAYQLTEFCLSPDALMLMDEWLDWLLTGGLPGDSVLADLRRELLNS